MYYIQFFRTCKNFLGDKKFVFHRACGYGVYVDNIEYAIARCAESPKEWDITEVSTGMSLDIDGEHLVFPSRGHALKWLNEFVKENDVKVRIKKHEDIRKALADYRKPYEKKKVRSVDKITLTEKQSKFLKQYRDAFGIEPCETKDIPKEIEMNPSIIGAMISTLVEKGVFETFLEGRTKYTELTEAGLKIMEETING